MNIHQYREANIINIKIIMKKLSILLIVALCAVSCTNNQNQQVAAEQETVKTETPVDVSEFKNIKLLPPDVQNKATLMGAFENRQSFRDFSDKNISLEDLSNLLWVAYGVNRPDGKRTVPSAMAAYSIEVYAVLPNGIYFYDAMKHELQPVAEGDYRQITGGQDFVYTAPLNILYITNLNNFGERANTVPERFLLDLAIADAGHSSQNVYLYCAAFDMKTVIRGGGMNESELLKVLKLDESKYRVPLAQTVGY